MQSKTVISIFSIVLLLTIGFPSVMGGGVIASSFLDKLSSLSGQEEAAETNHDIVLELPSIMNSVLNNPFLNIFTGPLKIDMMTNMLKQSTNLAQSPLITMLNLLGVDMGDITPFWISNKIFIRGIKLPVLKSLISSNLPGLFTIREPISVTVPIPVTEVRESAAYGRGNRTVIVSANAEVQWGVNKIEAPKVWSSKTKGAGIVVANIDTGVNVNHEALKLNYGGKWLDAISRQPKTTPYDDDGHGTHTMGTICGTTRGIGVCPGCKWIACKALDSSGNGNDVSLTKCAQWILQQKPKVVSNSWGGGKGLTFFNDEIAAWHKAGIIPIFSIGNSGPSCQSAVSPGDQDNVISVGSTAQDDTMSSFSSRGTSKFGNLLKPEISAPGDEILSAGIYGSNNYVTMSGTSMAAPHVAGAVALMLSAKPSMTFTQVRDALQNNADRPSVSALDLKCGKPSNGATYPNDAYGWGRMNIKKAMGL